LGKAYTYLRMSVSDNMVVDLDASVPPVRVPQNFVPDFQQGPGSPRLAPRAPSFAAPGIPAANIPPVNQDVLIQRPEPLASWANRLSNWDTKEQQMLRQQSGAPPGTRTVWTPPSTFAPRNLPLLATTADPSALRAQIDAITGQFHGVYFETEDIAARKAKLEAVERQIADLIARTTDTITLWRRQAVEYQSLAEYDAEVLRLRAQLRIAEGMCRGSKRARGRRNDDNC